MLNIGPWAGGASNALIDALMMKKYLGNNQSPSNSQLQTMNTPGTVLQQPTGMSPARPLPNGSMAMPSPNPMFHNLNASGGIMSPQGQGQYGQTVNEAAKTDLAMPPMPSRSPMTGGMAFGGTQTGAQVSPALLSAMARGGNQDWYPPNTPWPYR